MLKAVSLKRIASPIFTGVIKGVPYTLVQSAIPFIHISSGSIGNNGALTGVTALGRTYSGGAYCYYPANAIAAGVAAGWYWTVFSSTTAGTIYNSTYTSGTPAVGTATAFVTTGPGAFTGSTSEHTGPTVTMAGGSMGANGRIDYKAMFEANNTAGAKTPRIKLGATTFNGISALTTNVVDIYEGHIANRGSASAQIGNVFAVRANNTSLGAASITGTENTASDLAALISLQKAVATDNLVLETFAFQISYGA